MALDRRKLILNKLEDMVEESFVYPKKALFWKKWHVIDPM